jgi:hypothetical protein
MAIQPIGSLSIRPPETAELVHLDPSLRGKAQVAEWKSGLDPMHTKSVKLWVLNTDQGRRFDLAGCLNGWTSPNDAVREICSLGLQVAEAHQLIPAEQLGWSFVMFSLNIYSMPRISEFRKRSYAWGRDFKAAAKDQIGQMLAFDLGNEPKPGKRVSLNKDPRLNAAAEDVFPKAENVRLISRFALYIAKHWRQKDQMAPERIRQAVITSVLAGNLQQDEVSQANQTKTAEVLVDRVVKIAGQENKDMPDALIGLQRRGYRDIALSLNIPIEKVRRDILSLMASTFWDIVDFWNVVMSSIRSLVRPRLSAAELTVFDRLYLPQAHVADLPPYLLWPRYDLVMPVSLMLLDTPADEAWRLNAIPGNLEALAEMDDTTRRSDLERKGGRQRQARRVGNDGNGEFPGDWFEMQPPPTDDFAPIDEDVLKRLFAKSGGLPCPKCAKPVQDLAISSGTALQTVVLKLSPCGCTIPASDWM